MIDVAALVRAYGLKTKDKHSLVLALVAAFLAAFRAAYMRSAKNAGVSVTWTPDIADESQAQQIAEQDAESIANTYDDDLKRTVEVFLLAWKRTHDDEKGALPEMMVMLTVWCKARAHWKAEQITRVTIGRGLSAGTAALVNGLLSGDVPDTSGMGTKGLYVAVIPATSSSDLCKAYAGYMWPIDKYPGLGTFPAHVNCIHSEIVLRY